MREIDFNELMAEPSKELQDTLYPTLEFFSYDATPRTLLYGYDCDRNTHHVYSDENGDVILHVYKTIFGTHVGDEEHETRFVINFTKTGLNDLSALIPNKRLYPQYCDYDACVTLKSRNVNLPFTVYNNPKGEGKGEGPYYGVQGAQ